MAPSLAKAPAQAQTGLDRPETIYLSRPTFETLLRRLVKASRRNVQFVTGTVVSLRPEDQALAKLDVNGVVYRAECGQIKEVESVLVVGEQCLHSDVGYSDERDWIIDATGPVHAGYTKWNKDLPSSSPLRNLKDEYNAHKQVVVGVFRVPPHLQPLAPLPKGFQPGRLLLALPDVKSGEDRLFHVSIVEDGQGALLSRDWW